MRKAGILGLVLCAMASGCASVPVRYYSLLAAPAALPAENAVDCCRVIIASVKLPSAVDRPEIVVRRSDDELLVLSNELWIAPLREEVKAALSSEIRRSMANRVEKETWTQRTPPTVSVDVERFESVPSQYVLLQIAWHVTVSRPPKDLIAHCEAVNRFSIGEGVPALIHGYQQAIGAMGIRIATGIMNLEAANENGCGAG